MVLGSVGGAVSGCARCGVAGVARGGLGGGGAGCVTWAAGAAGGTWATLAGGADGFGATMGADAAAAGVESNESGQAGMAWAGVAGSSSRRAVRAGWRGRPTPSIRTARVMGMVLAGGEGKRLMPLTLDRAKPAVPFGGTYRLIDFCLSNVGWGGQAGMVCSVGGSGGQ